MYLDLAGSPKGYMSTEYNLLLILDNFAAELC